MTGSADPRGAFLATLYHALRSVRVQGIAVGDTRAALDRFRAACDPVLDDRGHLELRIVRRSMHLNGEVLPADLENFVFHAHVLETLRGAGIGALHLRGLPTRRDLQIFLPLMVRLSDPDEDPSRTDRLRQTIRSQGIRSITVQPPVEGAADDPGAAERRAQARRTYEESVGVSRELFTGTRMGRSANVDRVKRTVQDIVEGVLTNEASLGGLSALKDFDEYAFTHAVNVCIFCVAIGRRLGLGKAQLYDLGHAALVHDIGMSRVPREILTKGSALTEQERARIQAHTWLGALRIFELRDFGEVPLQSMLVAYEHHRTPDGGGYPAVKRERDPTIFSRIVAVAAAFDAATNERAYSRALPADEVLREFRTNESLGFDPIIVKALTNLLGAYPVGSCVVLDSGELALVHAGNPDPAFVSRPVARLLTDREGRWLDPAPLVDLADTDEHGRFLRSIARVTESDRYGIDPAHYFA
jgi:HD-GYP domain-containing protein (c-di-GMP phosphodiesterase class II)